MRYRFMRAGIILALAAPALLGAQTVRGHVVHGDGAGVPGVIVLLLDPAGRVAARALTGDGGYYRLVAPAAGEYSLRTLRIGFRPMSPGKVTLGAGQDVERRIMLDAVAFGLDTVRVASRARCAPYDSASVVADVWQQARTALTAAQLTAGNPVLGATMVRHERAIDARTRNERVLATRRESGFVNHGWTSLTADSLHRGGYVHELADGTNSWYAPDIAVLLSDRFLGDHCFRLTRAEHAMGVRFEPTRDRRVPEIEGTLWLDLRTGELRRLEFRYVNVPLLEPGKPGGDMEFARLASGAWAITRWAIRMPVFVERQRAGSGVPGEAPRKERVHVETRVASGELALVTHGGDTLYHAGVVVARAQPPGIVLDSIRVARRPAVPLPPVTSSAPTIRSEFEERRLLRAGGHFITQEDFAKWPGRRLPEFIAAVPGARLASGLGQVYVVNARGATATLRGPDPRSVIARQSQVGRACYVDVWLDGRQVYGSTPTDVLFDISTISPQTLEGVEYYASVATTPAKYARHGAECGTLLLWTRAR